MTILPRSVPIRATGILTTLAFLALEGILRHFALGVSDEILLAAIALVTVGVGGDTYRPSGVSKPAQSTSVTTVDITAAPPA